MNDRVDRFLAENLSPQELREFAEALRQPEHAEALIRAAADSWGLARGLVAAPAGAEPVPRRRPVLMPFLAGMVAAAAVLLALLWWPANKQPPAGTQEIPQVQARSPAPAVLTMVSGAPPIDAAARLASGQTLVFPAGSIGDLRLADGGSAVRATGPAELAVVSAQHLRCRRGHFEAIVVAQPAGQDWLLTTPHARCRVLGTRFTARVDEAATLLEVAEGRVELTPVADSSTREVVEAGASRLVADLATNPLAPLLHYRFTGRGEQLLACDEGPAERPALRDQLPPVVHDDGLLLTFANSCTTPVNTAWPRLAARLRQADGLTLIATVDLREPSTRGMLIAEVYGVLAADAGDGSDKTPVVFQLRCAEQLPAGTYTLATTWSSQGVMRRYVDGARMGDPFDKPYLVPHLADTVEVKLLMPYCYHRQDIAHAGVVFHDLKLYDQTLSAAEIAMLSATTR